MLLSEHPCLLNNPRTWRPRHAQLGADVDMSLSGRRPAAFEKVLAARPELKAARFLRCDIDDPDSLAAALEVCLDLRLVQGAGSLQSDSGSSQVGTCSRGQAGSRCGVHCRRPFFAPGCRQSKSSYGTTTASTICTAGRRLAGALQGPSPDCCLWALLGAAMPQGWGSAGACLGRLYSRLLLAML